MGNLLTAFRFIGLAVDIVAAFQFMKKVCVWCVVSYTRGQNARSALALRYYERTMAMEGRVC